LLVSAEIKLPRQKKLKNNGGKTKVISAINVSAQKSNGSICAVYLMN
jgi:hypothetical protein